MAVVGNGRVLGSCPAAREQYSLWLPVGPRRLAAIPVAVRVAAAGNEQMTAEKPQNEIPEIAAYTRYYEHDGMLRAYANRAMLLAILFASIAVGSLGFAIYVRIQPPTIIRIDKDGNAEVVGGTRQNRVSQLE